MLNLLAATGHINYAMSARLYLQLMNELPEKPPWLHTQLEKGLHTVRRSDRYWAGLWTDIVTTVTTVIADDTDILVLLLYHYIYLYSGASKRSFLAFEIL